jgi:hypothetical protein
MKIGNRKTGFNSEQSCSQPAVRRGAFILRRYFKFNQELGCGHKADHILSQGGTTGSGLRAIERAWNQ